MPAARILASLLLLASVGAGAFFGVRTLRDALGGDNHSVQAEAPPDPVYPLEALEAERGQPRFQGEILGIFIAPRHAPIPEKYLTYEELCGPEYLTAQVAHERAGQLDLHVQLPPEYVFQPDSMNTGVIACASRDQMEILGPESLRLKDPDAGTVSAARWDYSVTPSTGYPTHIVIVRSVLAYETFDAAETRVKTTTIGGRQAVLIEPVTPDGLGSASLVVFPEPFGKTAIAAFALPLADLLAVAEIVAEATK